MTPEQEIRMKALELKLNYTATMLSACIITGKACNTTKMWYDGDLEEFCAYISQGLKPALKVS